MLADSGRWGQARTARHHEFEDELTKKNSKAPLANGRAAGQLLLNGLETKMDGAPNTPRALGKIVELNDFLWPAAAGTLGLNMKATPKQLSLSGGKPPL